MLDFLGIGAQKSGTTWLYRMLETHPCIRFPAGKEVHFWDQRIQNGVDWYARLFSESTPGLRQGEITPAYSMLEPQTIQQVRSINPSLRIVFLIRNPMDRAWSSAQMALQRAEMTIDEASDQWFIDHFRSSGSMRRGDYETTLRRWRAVFSIEQVLLLRYENIRVAPLHLLQQCAKHLGVDPDHFAQLPKSVLSERVFGGSGHPVRESLRPVLTALYHDRIAAFAEYTGLDFRVWTDESDQDTL